MSRRIVNVLTQRHSGRRELYIELWFYALIKELLVIGVIM